MTDDFLRETIYMTRDELKERTKSFAHRCVKLAASLPADRLGGHLSGQLIRCSTSVAANYRAACVAQSRAAFVAKLSIVVEEADETVFWIEFIRDEGLVSEDRLAPLHQEASELFAIFFSSRQTARENGLGEESTPYEWDPAVAFEAI
jgi:four helix bundle protein